MISIQKQFFKTSSISHDILRHICQGAMALVDIFDLPIASFKQGNALKHDLSSFGFEKKCQQAAPIALLSKNARILNFKHANKHSAICYSFGPLVALFLRNHNSHVFTRFLDKFSAFPEHKIFLSSRRNNLGTLWRRPKVS